jgi:hypothetical protein
MRITLVGSTDLPELLPLVRAYCDFYQVAPSDRELLELSRALLADPEREGCNCWPATTPAAPSASPPCTGPGRPWPPPGWA